MKPINITRRKLIIAEFTKKQSTLRAAATSIAKVTRVLLEILMLVGMFQIIGSYK
jgi:hypothetical protein